MVCIWSQTNNHYLGEARQEEKKKLLYNTLKSERKNGFETILCLESVY